MKIDKLVKQWNEITLLGVLSPSGTPDAKAMEKMHVEYGELYDAMFLGKPASEVLLEACDVLYYIAKAVQSDLIRESDAVDLVLTLANLTMLDADLISITCAVKYGLRLSVGKNPEAETTLARIAIESHGFAKTGCKKISEMSACIVKNYVVFQAVNYVDSTVNYSVTIERSVFESHIGTDYTDARNLSVTYEGNSVFVSSTSFIAIERMIKKFL